VIVNIDNQIVIKHDEDIRLEGPGTKVEEKKAANGSTVTTFTRPDGSVIVTVTDKDGNIIRRTRHLPNGKEIVLFDTKPENTEKRNETIRFFLRLPPIRLNIPEDEYIVESRRANTRQLEQTLLAPPVEVIERPYSLDEIRLSGRIRDKVRRIDIDTINFDFGQATIPPDQVGNLNSIGQAISAIIQRNPAEVFLIEGHTDAVGTDLANLALSDRRAESVAQNLSYYYGIPPENLVTQGYGEQYLKVPTEEPERANRRATVRRITQLLTANNK